MISAHHGNYLVGLPKKIVEHKELLDHKLILPQNPFQIRIPLLCEDEDEFSFFMEVNQSAKLGIKVSLHLQEDTVNHGILRVDFNGRHKNPETANENVPLNFQPFTGLWLDDYPGHIHYLVDGYKPLVWAIPLEIDPFPVKKVADDADVTAAFLAFCKTVNIKTEISVTRQIGLFP